MSEPFPLLPWQQPRPILWGADPRVALGTGPKLFDRAIGRLARESPSKLCDLHRRELEAGTDVLTTFTESTTSRALRALGMAFRAAALTGVAVEQARRAADACERDVWVAGVVGGSWADEVDEERLREELTLHVARLATAGVDFLVVGGWGAWSERAFLAAVDVASTSSLPVVIRRSADMGVDGLVSLCESRQPASLLLDGGDRETLASLRARLDGLAIGVLLPKSAAGLEHRARHVVEAGAFAIGGAAGVATSDLSGVAAALRDDSAAER